MCSVSVRKMCFGSVYDSHLHSSRVSSCRDVFATKGCHRFNCVMHAATGTVYSFSGRILRRVKLMYKRDFL